MTIFEYLKERDLKAISVQETLDKRTRIWKYNVVCRDRNGMEQNLCIDGSYLHKQRQDTL